MLKGIFTVKSNENIAKDIYKMVLEGDTAAITAPGQFINIALDGFYLRRPISVCDFDSDTVTIIYKTVGRGTRYMSTLGSGAQLDVLSGLGNGFDTAPAGARPLLVGRRKTAAYRRRRGSSAHVPFGKGALRGGAADKRDFGL